ncbi:MAG: hypothetical protein ACPG5B_17480 [Chitinophagales bacterium]
MKDEDINFKEIMSKLAFAYHISNAILDDYAETISQLTDNDKEFIKKRVLDKAKKMFAENPIVQD